MLLPGIYDGNYIARIKKFSPAFDKGEKILTLNR